MTIKEAWDIRRNHTGGDVDEAKRVLDRAREERTTEFISLQAEAILDILSPRLEALDREGRGAIFHEYDKGETFLSFVFAWHAARTERLVAMLSPQAIHTLSVSDANDRLCIVLVAMRNAQAARDAGVDVIIPEDSQRLRTE